MNELIVHYSHNDNHPTCEVGYQSDAGRQETEKFPFTFTISPEDRALIQWYLEEYLDYPYGAFRDRAKQAEEKILKHGENLFANVFRNENDETQSAIKLYDRAMANPTDCQVVISADHPTGWAIPWEFMYGSDGYYLAQKTAGFIRSQPGVNTHLIPLRTGTPKIRILMVISRPEGERDVPFQSVARPLMEIFRPHKDCIQIDVLRPPTYEQLQKVLAENPNFYHILHFDGHGVFPHKTTGDYHNFLGNKGVQGQLVFEKAGGGKRLVSGAEFGELLRGKGVPMVMLNACQSGMIAPDALYPSVAGELIKTGASGVVAMAYSVYVRTAAHFMAQVYESLINGQTLARAVTIARESLVTKDARESPIGPISLKDWVVPVLFQSGTVRLFEQVQTKLHLDISILKDTQAEPGAEINLPEQPDYGFIGRDTEMWKLEKAFEQQTIVLLQAMAGVGKTTTAVAFARWWAETGALEGPIFFFSFESYTTLAHVCDQIGSIFRESIKAQIGIEWHLLEATKRRQLAVTILRQIPCLFIWDNFEPVAGFSKSTPSFWKEEEQQELKDFLHDLRNGATKVIITSRRDEEWIGKCYQRILLTGLNQREATELAGKIFARTGVNRQQLKPYDKLLTYLQGNPLAMQVILPELACVEPDQLLSNLQAGEAKLLRDDREQGRQYSLTASLEYRLDRLDELWRGRLGVLGIFQGFVNAGVLAAICQDKSAPKLLNGLDTQTWIQILEQTAEIGLLHKIADGFYNIHPAIPWFFHEILQATYAQDMEWLEQKFVKICGDLSQSLQQQLFINAETAMRVMQLEEQNLYYAIRVGCRYQMWDAIGQILSGLAEMLGRQSRWSEFEWLHLEVKNAATDKQEMPFMGAEALCASLWFYQGRIAQERRQFDEAEQWYRQSLAIKERLKNEYGQAITLHQLGRIAQERRQFDEAEQWYRQSLAIKERLKNEYGQAITLHQLGTIAQERREFDEAEQWYRQSLAIKERLKDEYGQANTLHQLGMIAQERREFAEAEQWYRQSLAIEERLKDEYGQAQTLHQLGRIAQERREFAEAEQWYRQSLAIEERLKNEYGQAITLHQLGMIAQERRQFDEAEQWYRQSLAISERLKDEYGQAQTLHQLGMIAQERRQFDEAEQWYRQSLAISERLKDEYGQAQTLHQLGMIAQERRQFDEAEQWYRQSLAIKERLKNEYGQASTLHQLGMIAEERREFEEAKKWYLLAQAIFEKHKDKYSLSVVHTSLSRLRNQASTS